MSGGYTNLYYGSLRQAHITCGALCLVDDEPLFLEDDSEQEQLTPSQRLAQCQIGRQALMDANMPAGRCPSLSQDLELTRLGGISPAERVFMYLQVPILSA